MAQQVFGMLRCVGLRMTTEVPRPPRFRKGAMLDSAGDVCEDFVRVPGIEHPPV